MLCESARYVLPLLCIGSQIALDSTVFVICKIQSEGIQIQERRSHFFLAFDLLHGKVGGRSSCQLVPLVCSGWRGQGQSASTLDLHPANGFLVQSKEVFSGVKTVFPVTGYLRDPADRKSLDGPGSATLHKNLDVLNLRNLAFRFKKEFLHGP